MTDTEERKSAGGILLAEPDPDKGHRVGMFNTSVPQLQYNFAISGPEDVEEMAYKVAEMQARIEGGDIDVMITCTDAIYGQTQYFTAYGIGLITSVSLGYAKITDPLAPAREKERKSKLVDPRLHALS